MAISVTLSTQRSTVTDVAMAQVPVSRFEHLEADLLPYHVRTLKRLLPQFDSAEK